MTKLATASIAYSVPQFSKANILEKMDLSFKRPIHHIRELRSVSRGILPRQISTPSSSNAVFIDSLLVSSEQFGNQLKRQMRIAIARHPVRISANKIVRWFQFAANVRIPVKRFPNKCGFRAAAS
ncbi:MAG: hypothetical protein QM785_16820 [Pyrinomonadaceae bacterium]